MSTVEVIILAIIQGLTEFLPISSSAHLILPSAMFGWEDQGLVFDVAVHVGTLLAVMLYFRNDIAQLTLGWVQSLGGKHSTDSKLAWWVILATIPAGLAGLLAADLIETFLRSPYVIAITTIVFGLALWLADATAKLTEMGLVIVEAPTAAHPEIPAEQISVQVPAKGEKLAKGGTVTITVSKGQTTTLIPTIYGKDLATVKERLLKYGMVIGKVTGNTKRGLKSALIDGKVVRNLERVIVGKTVDLVFP